MFLSPELNSAINESLGENCITDYDLSQLQHDSVNDIFGHQTESFKQFKSSIYQDDFIPASHIDELEPISTSIDFILGPLFRREVLSIEGPFGSGKTRLCLKLTHEVAIAGRVLFIDSNFTLSPQILQSIVSRLQLEGFPNYYSNPNDVPSEENPTSLHICIATTKTELFSIINTYLSHSKPDLIVIDSIMSLLQSSMIIDGPGSAELEEIACELKKLALKIGCAIVITNGSKPEEKWDQPRCTYLGKQYGYLWHSRALLFGQNSIVNTCNLYSSHQPMRISKFYLDDLRELSQEMEISTL